MNSILKDTRNKLDSYIEINIRNFLGKEGIDFLKERGEHGWAVIDGKHYVLLPHTDLNWPRGMGGAKMRIRFFDGYETICDNLWCQGEIPSGYWRDLMSDNAKFI